MTTQPYSIIKRGPFVFPPKRDLLSSYYVNILDYGGIRTGVAGTEDANFAAWTAALDAARTYQVSHPNFGASAIFFPPGAYRFDQTIGLEDTDEHIGIVGAGRTSTTLLIADQDADLLYINGGTSSSGILETTVSGIKFQYTGGDRSPSNPDSFLRPALVRCRNVHDFTLTDTCFEGGYNGLMIDRGARVQINGIQVFARSNVGFESYCGIGFTSYPDQLGTCTRIYLSNFDITNRGTGPIAYTHGILIECTDGFQADLGHIHLCRNDLTISPDNSANQDVCGGIIFNNTYFDAANTYSVLIEGAATSFGRMYFHGCRSINAGADGYRINPSSLLTLMQINNGDIMGAGRYGVNCATANIYGLSINNPQFRENNTELTANAGDMILRGSAVRVRAKVFGGGAPGTAVTLGADLTGNNNTIEVDTSDSTAGTLFNDASSSAQRYPSEIEAQTYTPTLTAVTNLDTVTLAGASYRRFGSLVSVEAAVEVDPTATGSTEFGISLPIASAFSSTAHANGVATSTTEFGRVAGDATNDRLSVVFTAVTTTVHTMSVMASYRII